MSVLNSDAVLKALEQVSMPGAKKNIVEQGIVSEIFIADGKVIFSIGVPAEHAQTLDPLREKAEQVVSKLEGVKSVMVALTAEKKGGASGAAQSGASSASSAPSAASKNAAKSGSEAGGTKAGVPGIDSIIAVASGKGGVGKSTTSVNIALALAANGLRVGILDADIYGPSMPRLLGITDKPEAVDGGKILKPMIYQSGDLSIKVMSIGFLVAEDTAMIWRGPMVISALTQMLRQVEWGVLDALVVDMPPGTGDAQLTMAQQVPLAGALIVSTPQDLALIDARKGINMFNRVEVPILGLVENMSYFICPDCGEQHNIFGNGGAKSEAQNIGASFLGAVPLHMDIRENSDAGTPVVASAPDGEHAKIYKQIATKLWDRRNEEVGANAAPSIVFE